MTSSPRSRLHASLAIGGVLVVLGICDFVVSDRQVRPWVLLGVGGLTVGSAVRQLRRGSDPSAADPTLRQAFWMFGGFLLFGIATIAVATKQDGLTLAVWLALGIFVGAYGAMGLFGVAWMYRAEKRDERR